ncbi:MAG: cupin domain-containing protein [Bacteroidota bacterium]|nr:cupin domain-containing protein [Bacteroidota bacterium]
MNRGKFILSSIALIPLAILAKFAEVAGSGSNNGFKVASGEARAGKRYKMKGITTDTLDVKISSGDTNGELAIFEQTGSAAKGGPPLHLHLHQDEWFYIIEGEYLFQVGDQKYPMKAGDTIFLPRNVQHGYVQLTEKARVIVSFMPAGQMEEFFKLTDSWTSIPSDDEIAEVFEDHGMKITGPPLKA